MHESRKPTAWSSYPSKVDREPVHIWVDMTARQRANPRRRPYGLTVRMLHHGRSARNAPIPPAMPRLTELEKSLISFLRRQFRAFHVGVIDGRCHCELVLYAPKLPSRTRDKIAAFV